MTDVRGVRRTLLQNLMKPALWAIPCPGLQRRCRHRIAGDYFRVDTLDLGS